MRTLTAVFVLATALALAGCAVPQSLDAGTTPGDDGGDQDGGATDGGGQDSGVVGQDAGDQSDGGSGEKDGAGPGDQACTGKSQWDPCTKNDFTGFCLNLQGDRVCVRQCTTPGEPCPNGTCYYAGLNDKAACLATGTRAAGESCHEPNDCAAGMICTAYNNDTELCRPLCGDAKTCTVGDCQENGSGIHFCVVGS